jgi:glycosyltransferase involved in cell wall biosynthesis
LKKVIYRYYFRGSLSTHVHFFEAWVNAVQQHGIDMRLITFLKYKEYFNQIELVKYYRQRSILIYPDLSPPIISTMYFTFQCFIRKRVIVHLKKRDAILFDFLKKIFPGKLRYIHEGEGDPKMEMDYLKKHPYKLGFYDQNVSALESDLKKQKKLFQNADLITYGYPEMKDALISRYPELGLEKKIVLVPMTFGTGKLYYSKSARMAIRQKLNLSDHLVFTYIGNVYYSWQNFFRTIEIVKLLGRKLNRPTFSIFLISISNHDLANDIIQKVGLNDDDYILTNSKFDEMPKYLSAADMGIVLRHDHSMNRTTPSGKVLDYLGCGLPVLTTAYMADISSIIRNNKFGVVLGDMDNDEEIMNGIIPYLNVTDERRKIISEWANQNISIEKHIPKYVSKLEVL